MFFPLLLLLPGDQHDSEAGFVSHHPSVSFGSPECFRGQRNGLDHRTDLLQGWESVSSASIEEPVIVPASERIPNRSGTGSTLIGSSPPAPATISWPRKLSGLAARSKSSEQRRHGFAIGRCREDQSGTAQGLKRGNQITRAALSTSGCQKSNFLSVLSLSQCSWHIHPVRKRQIIILITVVLLAG